MTGKQFGNSSNKGGRIGSNEGSREKRGEHGGVFPLPPFLPVSVPGSCSGEQGAGGHGGSFHPTIGVGLGGLPTLSAASLSQNLLEALWKHSTGTRGMALGGAQPHMSANHQQPQMLQKPTQLPPSSLVGLPQQLQQLLVAQQQQHAVAMQPQPTAQHCIPVQQTSEPILASPSPSVQMTAHPPNTGPIHANGEQVLCGSAHGLGGMGVGVSDQSQQGAAWTWGARPQQPQPTCCDALLQERESSAQEANFVSAPFVFPVPRCAANVHGGGSEGQSTQATPMSGGCCLPSSVISSHLFCNAEDRERDSFGVCPSTGLRFPLSTERGKEGSCIDDDVGTGTSVSLETAQGDGGGQEKKGRERDSPPAFRSPVTPTTGHSLSSSVPPPGCCFRSVSTSGTTTAGGGGSHMDRLEAMQMTTLRGPSLTAQTNPTMHNHSPPAEALSLSPCCPPTSHNQFVPTPSGHLSGSSILSAAIALVQQQQLPTLQHVQQSQAEQSTAALFGEHAAGGPQIFLPSLLSQPSPAEATAALPCHRTIPPHPFQNCSISNGVATGTGQAPPLSNGQLSEAAAPIPSRPFIFPPPPSNPTTVAPGGLSLTPVPGGNERGKAECPAAAALIPSSVLPPTTTDPHSCTESVPPALFPAPVVLPRATALFPVVTDPGRASPSPTPLREESEVLRGEERGGGDRAKNAGSSITSKDPQSQSAHVISSLSPRVRLQDGRENEAEMKREKERGGEHAVPPNYHSESTCGRREGRGKRQEGLSSSPAPLLRQIMSMAASAQAQARGQQLNKTGSPPSSSSSVSSLGASSDEVPSPSNSSSAVSAPVSDSVSSRPISSDEKDESRCSKASIIAGGRKERRAGGLGGATSRHPLVQALLQHQPQDALKLLEGGESLDPQSVQTIADPDGRTPLHLAAQRGRRWEPVVLRLLDFGLEVDRPDKFGWTALHLSSLFGHSSTCALLAEKGADVHAVTENGCTPLHMACWQHHKRVVAELLGRGASPLRPNKFGETPLYLASDASLVSLLSVFVSKVNQGNMGARGGDCSREADGGEKSAAAAGAVCQQRASTETSGFASVAETHPTRIPPVAFPPSHGAKTGTREAEFVSSADEVPQRREHPQLKQHQQGERWGGRGTDGVRGGWNRERNRPSSSCFPSHSSHFHNSHTHAATRLALPPGLSGRHQHAHHQQLRSVQTKAGTQLRGGWYAPPSVSSQPSSGDELADMSTWVQIPDVHTDAHRGRQWSGRMTQAQRDLSGPGWMMPSSSVDAGGWNVLVSGSSFPPVPHEIEEHGGNRLRRFSMGNENERGNHQTETEQLGVPVGEMRRYTEGA